MLVPGALYGSHGDVKRRCTKALRAVAKGARWTDAFMTDGMLDVDKTPGVLMLDGPSVLIPGTHFHLYLPPRVTQHELFNGMVPAEREDEIYADCLTTSWGTLTLMSSNHTFIHPLARYVNPPARERPTLEAVVRYWREWDTLGSRFSQGNNITERIAELPTAARYLLVHGGIAPSRLVGHVLDDFLELAAEVGVRPK